MGGLSKEAPFHHQHYTWVCLFYYLGLELAELVIVWAKMEADWMENEVVEVVDPTEEPCCWVVEKMGLGKMGLGLESTDIEDRLKVVDRAANRLADMSGYHGHNLSNLEQIGLMEETKFSRAWVHSMNSE